MTPNHDLSAGLTFAMTRGGLVRMLVDLPNAEVVVDVAGILIDVNRVTYLRERDAVVMELQPDDVDDVLRTLRQGHDS